MVWLTIVIPSLNQGRFINQALQSVLKQGIADVEIIVIDGGSVDGTGSILCEWEKELGNHTGIAFRWVSEPDRGQSDALNKGFAVAQGEWLTWLNADDVMLPNTLSLVREQTQRGGEWITGNMIYMDEKGRVLRCVRDGRWHDWVYRNALVRVYGPSSFFTKALFARAGGALDTSFRYVMDTDLWLRFKHVGARFEKINSYFWGFRRHFEAKTNGGKAPEMTPCWFRGHLGTKGDEEGLVQWRQQKEETTRMYLKNGFQTNRLTGVLGQFWRLLNGAYIRAYYDTLRLRGREIAS